MRNGKLHLEYAFHNVSLPILWNTISSPVGLQSWFADNVHVSGSVYAFSWKKHNQEAEIKAVKPLSHIRFHWLDDDLSDSYFEMRIHISEVTGDTILEVIDYSQEEDQEDTKNLWDSQIDLLKRKLGIQ